MSNQDAQPLQETITLSQAKSLIKCLAHDQSLLFLSPPGVGKSDTVIQAAEEAGMPCRSLLGTQIAPEDVSGIPHIVGERSVFCPPRILLPEKPEPFCLFLDELPACPPDIQKAFYALLLERRLGEHTLPKGSWVVAAGNRAEDRALVRSISSALINRVIVLNVRVDVKEWLVWAKGHGVRSEILAFVTKESWTVDAILSKGDATFAARLVGTRGDTPTADVDKLELGTQAEADAVAEALGIDAEGRPTADTPKFVVEGIDSRETSRQAPMPVALSELMLKARQPAVSAPPNFLRLSTANARFLGVWHSPQCARASAR